MARYLLLWEVDSTRTPEDPEERKSQWRAFQDNTKQMIESKQVTDWGEFVGSLRGFSIVDGSAEDVLTLTARWIPWVDFETYELMSIDQAIRAIEAM